MTVPRPEKVALISSLDQRAPGRLFSMTTGHIFSSTDLTCSSLLSGMPGMLPMWKERLSGSEVSRLLPGVVMVAPHSTVTPMVCSGPMISAMLSSGMPFCMVTITPSSAR